MSNNNDFQNDSEDYIASILSEMLNRGLIQNVNFTSCFVTNSNLEVKNVNNILYMKAKSAFDKAMFNHVAEILKGRSEQIFIFLRCYSLYLQGLETQSTSFLTKSKVLLKVCINLIFQDVLNENINEDNTETTSYEFKVSFFKESTALIPKNLNLEYIKQELLEHRENLDSFNLWLLGTICQQLHQISEAIEYFQQSLRNCAYLISSWINLFNCILQNPKNDYICEIKNKNDIYTLEGFLICNNIQKHPAVMIAYIEFLLMAGEFSQAHNLLSNLFDIIPNNLYLINLGTRCAYHLNLIDEYFTLLTYAQKIDYNDLSLITYTCNMLLIIDDKLQLRNIVSNCVLSQPHSYTTYVAMSIYYKAYEMFDKQLRCLKIAASKQPFECEIWLLIAAACKQNSDYDMSLIAYKIAESVAPYNYKCYLGSGDVLVCLQKYNDAIICYLLALQIFNNKNEIWYKLGNVLEKTESINEAVHCFKKAFELEASVENLISLVRCMKTLYSEEIYSLWLEFLVMSFIKAVNNKIPKHLVVSAPHFDWNLIIIDEGHYIDQDIPICCTSVYSDCLKIKTAPIDIIDAAINCLYLYKDRLKNLTDKNIIIKNKTLYFAYIIHAITDNEASTIAKAVLEAY